MDKRKISAAIAAVTAYIRTGEAAAAGMIPASDTIAPEAKEKVPAGSVNIWGISGRQHTMQMRGLMQMKTFHKTKT